MKPLLVGSVLAIAATGCWAQTSQVGQAGRLLASNCFQCHGTNGKGPGFERLAGESANEIYKELKEFQAKQSSNNIMAKHAKGYTDAQMRALAAYLATQR
ncbi:MAG TPA: c-type cytochrome [Ottowia sp.]|nr:c-type cytochrome [Ottowia sp.]